MKTIKFDKIIVHPGKSHVDEIIATALALGAKEGGYDLFTSKGIVFRRDPTQEELDDPSVLVLDVGGQLDPERLNFDHHQLDPADCKCAYALLAEHLGVADGLAGLYSWYNTWSAIDSVGPFKWADANNIKWGVAVRLLNPLMDMVHAEFERATGDRAVGYPLEDWLATLGKDLLASVEEYDAFVKEVGKHPSIYQLDGLWVLDLAWAPSGHAQKYAPAICTSIERSDDSIDIAVVVSPDDRGEGLSFFRRKDNPALDFHQCEGQDYCLFAHRGGFVLKTKKKVNPTMYLFILRDARTGKER